MVSTAKEANNIFEMLSDGGYVTLQPVDSFYNTFHAAVTDRDLELIGILLLKNLQINFNFFKVFD